MARSAEPDLRHLGLDAPPGEMTSLGSSEASPDPGASSGRAVRGNWTSPDRGGGYLFRYTDHIHLPALDLALDPPRRSPFAFVSHAHTDHIGRHLAGLATPATVALVAQRLGASRLTPLEFGQRLVRSDHQIWLAPAGHVLGAAQVIVESPDGQRLVYTGDFSVRARRSIQPATPLRADILIMECTYGLPQYVFPPDEEIRERLDAFIASALADAVTPVLLGYALGKAQEAMALVSSLGYPVCVHPTIAALANVYRRFGAELGRYDVYQGTVPAGQVLIAPPSLRRDFLPPRSRTLYLSGWALDPAARYRLGVDDALPLSDHADFTELVSFVTRVQPREVYTTHGPPAFADHLRRLGFAAQHLGVER